MIALMIAGAAADGYRAYRPVIAQALVQADPAGRAVLRTAHRMVAEGVIVRGSCWDYLQAVYRRAGYPRARRTVVLRHPKSGPYATAAQIRPGDWLYYINHSYGDVEHSGLFVGWIDRRRMQGLILSYGGQHRKRPGRYRTYDLDSVYQITRAH